MTQSYSALPDRLEQECLLASKTRLPVLLVGDDRSLLARLALRIHALTDGSWSQCNLQEYSCPTMWWFWDRHKLDGPFGEIEMPSRASMNLSQEGSIHFSDVQAVKARDAEGLFREMYAPVTVARLIFSSTVAPEEWPRDTPRESLLGELRTIQRIDVEALVNSVASDPVGLRMQQDDDGCWIFRLDGKVYPPVSGKAHGFQYIETLCGSPGREFSPKELRDQMNPNRSLPIHADSDRARVRKALELVMAPGKNIHSEVRRHLRLRLRYGTVCVYRPVPK